MYVATYMCNDCSTMHFEKIVFTGPLVSTVSVMKIFESSVIVVQWDKVADVSNYTVNWTGDGTLSSHTQIDQSFTLNGLTLDRVYNISVTATNSLCTGPEFITSVLFSAGTVCAYHFRYIRTLCPYTVNKSVNRTVKELFCRSQCCDKPTLCMTVLRDNIHN